MELCCPTSVVQILSISETHTHTQHMLLTTKLWLPAFCKEQQSRATHAPSADHVKAHKHHNACCKQAVPSIPLLLLW